MLLAISPFVKWAGGKTQLLKHLEDLLPDTFGTYYEPFIGGGAFLFDTQPQHAVINDINEQLINVYRQLKADPEAVIAAIRELDSIPCDKERYLAVRQQYNEKISSGELDAPCASLIIWVNKHCFNGLYRVNGKGLFNVPYNNKTGGVSMDENNLRGIGQYFRDNDVKIMQGDFMDACADVKDGDFVYFDSPYVPVSDTANFTSYTKDGFALQDHMRLADLFRELSEKGAQLMLSNHNVPLVHELYQGFNIHEMAVRRFINSDATKRTGKEVIITNY